MEREERRDGKTFWLVTLQSAEGGRGSRGGEEGERRSGGLLSSDLSEFEPVHKLLDCLVLQVGAHIAGEGALSVALFGGSERERERGTGRGREGHYFLSNITSQDGGKEGIVGAESLLQ